MPSENRGVEQRTENSFRAYLGANGRRLNLGHFRAKEAAQARDLACKRIHGDFASLNFPEAA
jgi:hypothetical protein